MPVSHRNSIGSAEFRYSLCGIHAVIARTTYRVVRRFGRCLVLAALACVAACGLNFAEPVTSVTIEMQCVSTVDCPGGFACIEDSEHGPPVRLCESSDASATCPAGYETKVLYGQTFCRPPTSILVYGAR
jgi:hypothetical protein